VKIKVKAKCIKGGPFAKVDKLRAKIKARDKKGRIEAL